MHYIILCACNVTTNLVVPLRFLQERPLGGGAETENIK